MKKILLRFVLCILIGNLGSLCSVLLGLLDAFLESDAVEALEHLTPASLAPEVPLFVAKFAVGLGGSLRLLGSLRGHSFCFVRVSAQLYRFNKAVAAKAAAADESADSGCMRRK